MAMAIQSKPVTVEQFIDQYDVATGRMTMRESLRTMRF